MHVPGQRRFGQACVVVLFFAVAMIPQSIRAADVPRLDITSYQCTFPLDETIALDELVDECEIVAEPETFLLRDTDDKFSIHVPESGYFFIALLYARAPEGDSYFMPSRIFCTTDVILDPDRISLDMFEDASEIDPTMTDDPIRNKLIFENGWPDDTHAMTCLWFAFLESIATPAA
jgi:hypothetical protein